MARALCMAVACMLATAVVQAKLFEGGLLMMKNPGAMLTEIEGMVHSGETPAFELIATIKSLVQDDIMPSLQNTVDAAAQETADNLNVIRSCNNASKHEEGEIAGSVQESVNDTRSLHADCREAEKVLYYYNLTDADSYCVKLGMFLHDTKPLRFHDGLSRHASVEYVKSASNEKMCDASTVTELDNGCTAKEQELASKKAECSAKQGSFEVAFCVWKSRLESNCKELDTCYSDAVTFYDNHKSKTQTLVEKWNVEFAALHKILCYCDVWLSETDKLPEGDNRSQHNATQFDACKNKTHTPVPFNYGTPAVKVACPLTSVANHPGTSGFITQEYNNFTDFVEQVVPCTEAATAASSTAAP